MRRAGPAGREGHRFVAWKLAIGPLSRLNAISFGDFGGFHVGEVLLILNSFFGSGVALRAAGPHSASRPSSSLSGDGIFLLGLGLATASNQQVDFRIPAYHATWHIVSAFGFVVLWVFNQAQFG